MFFADECGKTYEDGRFGPNRWERYHEKVGWTLKDWKTDYMICLFSNIILYVSDYNWIACVVGCRKKKAVHKTTTTDDKRLQSTLKRIGVNAIPAIEEVNIFKEDVVIQFTNPKGLNYALPWDFRFSFSDCCIIFYVQFKRRSQPTLGLLVALLRTRVCFSLLTLHSLDVASPFNYIAHKAR